MTTTSVKAADPVAPDTAPAADAGRRSRRKPRGRAGSRPLPREVSSAPKPASTKVGNWLSWQCQMISGVHRGAVYITPNGEIESLQPAAFWPADAVNTSALRNAAIKALHTGSGMIRKVLDKEDARREVLDYVAFPLMRGMHALGVVVLAMEMRSEVQRRAVLQLLQWGAVWLEDTLAQETDDNGDASSLSLQAIALLTQELPLPVIGNQLCTLLADKLGCTRVALGLQRGLQVQLVALSHQVRFDRRVEALGRIESAMEECVDQDLVVSLPMMTRDAAGLNRTHITLLDDPETGAVFSAPLQGGAGPVGALTLFWDKAERLDRPTADLLKQVARNIGRALWLKQREDRSLWQRLRESGRRLARDLVGGGHLRFKLTLGGLLLFLSLASVLQTEHRISARSQIEGTLQQAVVAPMAGYLSAAHVRAGDQVERDQVLAVLDDRELRLERERQISERDKFTKEYQEALAGRDRAQISITRARIAQAEAQLRLAEEQLQRTELRAPFAGTVVSGDLSRAIGAPLERGQLLFEIVPSDAYRINLEVDEHDVAGLAAGQKGRLRLTGLPDALIPFRVSRVVPIAEAAQGGNHFRVEAELKELPDGLRPGMQGVAKVVVGEGSYLWVWTHELIDRLRLWAWSAGF